MFSLNKELAELFRITAIMSEVMDDNPYRSRAFEKAALTVEGVEEDICSLGKAGLLETLPGIGENIAKYIEQWCSHGTFKEYDRLKAIFPEGLFKVLRIPGLGPRKVKLLYEGLGITSTKELEYACLENRLSGIKGFGAKSQEKILKALKELEETEQYRHCHEAYALLETFTAMTKELKSIRAVALVGGMRRFQECFDDMDLLIDAPHPKWIDELRQTKIIDNIEVLTQEKPFRLKGRFQGFTVDIREGLTPETYFYFTGNTVHTSQIVNIAEEHELVFEDFAFFEKGKRVTFDNEKTIYEKLNLPFIPPELREGLGEIEKAQEGALPELIEQKDIQGIFHIHTTFSDGSLSLEKIVMTALAIGYSYIGISDHSLSASYAGGLTLEKIKNQKVEVEHLRGRYPNIDIYWGIESDIKTDGSLDYPEEVLRNFDFVIGSVHSHFKMDRETMTKRIIAALKNPFLTMLGHPTGRLILGRGGYEVDMGRILMVAKEKNKIIELNAHPYRLDLDWRHCMHAKAMGIPISINPDIHKIEDFDLTYGLMAARKGYLSSQDVWNARDRETMRKLMTEKPWRQ